MLAAASLAAALLAAPAPLAEARAHPSAAAGNDPASTANDVSSRFWDVPDGHQFAEAIAWMVGNELTTGYPDGGFHPTAPVTRQAAAAFLARYGRADDDPTDCTTAPFPDVPVDHPFCAEIAWLADADISGGYADGTFRPAATVSRQAMAAFLFRLQLPTPRRDATCSTAPFPDVPAAHPFCGEIAWLAGRGVTQGYPDGGFHPTAAVSRQAAAAFLFALDPGCQPAERPRGCPGPATVGDLDGDGAAEVSWHSSTDGRWSQAGTTTPVATFAPGGYASGGDWDGDGAWDAAVVDLATGRWSVAGLDDVVLPPPPCATDPGPSPAYEIDLVPVVGDWDGDRRDDPGWYCEADATWHRPGHAPVAFGEPKRLDSLAFDVPVPADYDGDGADEPAVYRVRDGSWRALGSSEPLAEWMGVGLPLPVDVDGDGDDDPLLATIDDGGRWQTATGPWEDGPGADPSVPDRLHPFPAPADHDGDGRSDRATLYVDACCDDRQLLHERDGQAPVDVGPGWGTPGTWPYAVLDQVIWFTFTERACAERHPDLCPRPFVDGDLDGDGLADPAWVRHDADAQTWTWHVAPDPTVLATAPDDALPVTGDFDGDGRWEPAWVDPATGTWTTTGRRGTLALAPPTCGAVPLLGDGVVPVVGDFDHDGRDDPAWYCVATGTWHLDGGATLALGSPYPTSPAWAAGGSRPDEYYDLPLVYRDPDEGDVPAPYSPVDGMGPPGDVVSPLGLAFGGCAPGVHRFIGYQMERIGQPDWVYPFGPGTSASLPGPIDVDGDGTPEAAAVGLDGGVPAYLIEGAASVPLGFSSAQVGEDDAIPATMPTATLLDVVRITLLERDCYDLGVCPPGFTWPDHVPPP